MLSMGLDQRSAQFQGLSAHVLQSGLVQLRQGIEVEVLVVLRRPELRLFAQYILGVPGVKGTAGL